MGDALGVRLYARGARGESFSELGQDNLNGDSILSMTLPPPTAWASDRKEAIQVVSEADATVIVPGVELKPLAAEHNGARGLFTGLLSLASSAVYRLYSRRCTEALVLLAGDIAVDVEDRRYRLKPIDAVTVPAGLPRRVVNLSNSRPALVHVSLAASAPVQSWVNGRFTPVEQPATSSGRPGAERVCRSNTSARYELAPRAMFQDLFNAALGAEGICGGYGSFEPGARLPCHRHEFDESITIVKGAATCVVEGRRHELSDNATALVPQGLCHYFINLTLEPMAMVWVYAGGKPDRIVMDESYCHPEKAKK
jgi:mannose-6-phosphate isomerase-like protein (cupin superfamily)